LRLVDVLDEEVGFLVVLDLGEGGHDSERLSVQERVVHLGHAPLSLLLRVELQITITLQLIRSLVDYDFSCLNFVASATEKFVEIEVEEIFLGKVADIETRILVLLFLVV
jgi:hypothetical protein